MDGTASPAPRLFDFGLVKSPAKAKPIDNLDEVLGSSLLLVGQRRKERSQALQLEASRAAQEIRREWQHVEDCKADLATLAELTKAAQRIRADGDAIGHLCYKSIDAAKDRAKVVGETLAQLQQEKESRERELLLAANAAANVKFGEVTTFLALYRERLGLIIDRVAAQTVKLSFTLLDAAQPDREFSIILSLADGHVYRCLDCSPMLPSLKLLLEDLNEEPCASIALPTFLCGLRRAFKG